MIRFNKLEIQSFKSIYNCSIDFNSLGNKLYSLEGVNNTSNFASSNGAGKSTIFQALCYVLYGTSEDTGLKKSDYQNNNTNVKLKLTLYLEIQEVDYKIERTDSSFKLYILKNKTYNDISELTKTDTEKQFLKLLSITKNEFCNFTYLAQNGGSFLNKTPSEKLNCIKDFIFGEDILNIQEKIQTVVNSYSKEEKDIRIKLANIEGKISTLQSIVEKQKDCVVETFPYSLNEYKEKLISLKQVQNNKQQLIVLQSKFKTEIQNLKYKLEVKIKEYNKAKDGLCPTCGQHLQNNVVLSDIKQTILNIKQEYQKSEQELKNIEQKLKDIPQNIDIELEDINKIIVKIEEQSNQINLLDVQEDVDNNIKLKVKLETKLQDCLNKLSIFKNLLKYSKTTFIQHLQQLFLQDVEDFLNLYCYDIFNTNYNLVFDSGNLVLKIGDKNYSYFSGGERERIDFVFVFAIKSVLKNYTNKCTNLLIADESLHGQDSQAFEGCLDLLNTLTESENLTTILVSHKNITYQKNKIIISRYDNKTELKVLCN